MNPLKLNSKQDLLTAFSNNREITKSYGVNSLGIWGSFSSGSFNDTSDVDFLVNISPAKKSFDNFMIYPVS